MPVVVPISSEIQSEEVPESVVYDNPSDSTDNLTKSGLLSLSDRELRYTQTHNSSPSRRNTTSTSLHPTSKFDL